MTDAKTMTDAQYVRTMKNFQEIAKDQPVAAVEIIHDALYIFTTELGMYRIADKYTKIQSKGFSKNLDTWYVSISWGV